MKGTSGRFAPCLRYGGYKNPVSAGFVSSPTDWIYSSARDYAGEKGLLDIILLE